MNEQNNGEYIFFPYANRAAILSSILALLAFLSFCVGVLPLPISALFCYPSSLLLSLGALWTGTKALRQIRESGGNGRNLALIGVWAGGLSLTLMTCAVIAVVIFWPYLAEFVQNVWAQISGY